MYEIPKKTCSDCNETKYVFEFQRIDTYVSKKCKDCLKAQKKLSENERLAKTAPPANCWWERPKWRSKHSTPT